MQRLLPVLLLAGLCLAAAAVLAGCARDGGAGGPAGASAPPSGATGVESEVVYVQGETEIVQPKSTAIVETESDGKQSVVITESGEGGAVEHRVTTADTDFTAESVGVDVPPEAKLEKSSEIESLESSRPMLPGMAGAKAAIYTVGDMTVDGIVEFYTSHESGDYSLTLDGREMGLPAVLIGTSENPEVQIAIQVAEGEPPVLMILDLSGSAMDMSESEAAPKGE